MYNELSRRTAMVCLYCHGGQQQPDARYSTEGCQTVYPLSGHPSAAGL